MVFRSITRRDAFLILLGAASVHVWSFFSSPASRNPFIIGAHLLDVATPTPTLTPTLTTTTLDDASQSPSVPVETNTPVDPFAVPPTALSSLPHTTIAAHAPGWTLFRDLYMSNGTLLLVSPSQELFPELRMMTSTGLVALNTPENIALREPTKENMDFLTPEQAHQRWATDDESAYRVLSIKGNSVSFCRLSYYLACKLSRQILYNDPSQFLHHYYHFVAELFFGTWAFWLGAFTQPSPSIALSLSLPQGNSLPPPIHRAIFIHSDEEGWHDHPGFNGYFLRAAFPSLPVESQASWEDLARSTRPTNDSDPNQKAWHFPYALLVDRSAAHRGLVCGTQTQRTAAEAWQQMLTTSRLVGVHAGRWWDPLRQAVWRYAGVRSPDAVNWMNQHGQEDQAQVELAKERGVTPDLVRQGAFQSLLPMPNKVTITYISRQPSRGRKLTPQSNFSLVKALVELVDRRNAARTEEEDGPEWDFNLVVAEELTKDEQIQIAARTTVSFSCCWGGVS